MMVIMTVSCSHSPVVVCICDHAQLQCELTGLTGQVTRPRSRQRPWARARERTSVSTQTVLWDFQHEPIQ